MKIIAIVCLIVAVAGWLGTRFVGLEASRAAEAPESALFGVKRADLVIAVVENGYLKAKNNEEIKPKFQGGEKLTWLIEEGEVVVEGAILAEFDKTEVERRIASHENELIQYEAEYEAATSALAIQERDNTASIEKAELALELKTLELERYERGDLPNEKRKLLLTSEKADSELERAIERFEQVPELEREGFLTRIQVEEERILLREAEINKENAQRELELYDTYTTSMERKQKQSDLKDAERELVNAREKATINVKEKQARVTQKKRQIDQTQETLREEREQLGYRTITAPGPGLVYYGDPGRSWMRDQIKVGNTLSSGHTLFTLPDLHEMQVLVQVHEADIDLVKKEMEVVVTVETHKDRTFAGKVTDIASVANSQSWTDDSNKTFEVEITLEPTDVELRAGVTAKVEIKVERLPDVLQVPIHAIVPGGGVHRAFVWKDGRAEERIVQVGKNDPHFVQIVDGLAEGERVLLYDPREGEAIESGAVPGAAPADEASEGGLSADLAGMAE